jgi:TPR repeat protein
MSESRKTERFYKVRQFARAGALVITAAALASPLTARANLSTSMRPVEKMIAENRYDEAQRLLQAEARRGNIYANLELGRLHEAGLGVAKSPQLALSHYRKAGLPSAVRARYKGGIAEAQWKVAQMYTQGVGTQADSKAALKWLRWAADGGHPEAQLLYANAVLNGQGIRANPRDALFWATLAEKRGASDAALLAQIRADAQTRMTSSQLAQVERRLASWEPRED